MGEKQMKKKEWAGLAIGMAGAAAFSFGGLELYLKYRAGMTLWGSMLINFLRFWLCMLVPAVIAAWLKDRGEVTVDFSTRLPLWQRT